jgi:hypothetical protein
MDEFSGGADADELELTEQDDALRVLLVEAGGNVSQLARDLGRSRRTVRNWLSGVTPRGGPGALIDAATRSMREMLAGPRLDELRNGFETVTLGGVLEISDPENRTLEIAFTPGYGDQLVDAYLNGADADELERIFVEGIADPWYQDYIGNPSTWDTEWIQP